MAATRVPFVVFIARSSGTHDIDYNQRFLNQSLDYTEYKYGKDHPGYDSTKSERIALSRVRSNNAWPAHSQAIVTLHTILRKARLEQRSVDIVVNRFDGITTNMVNLVNLFDAYLDVPMKMLVFHDVPRVFMEADFQSIVRFAQGILDAEEYPDSDPAKVIYQRMVKIGAIKHMIGEDTKRLIEQSKTRNWTMEMETARGHRCEFCLKLYASAGSLRSHRSQKCSVRKARQAANGTTNATDSITPVSASDEDPDDPPNSAVVTTVNKVELKGQDSGPSVVSASTEVPTSARRASTHPERPAFRLPRSVETSVPTKETPEVIDLCDSSDESLPPSKKRRLVPRWKLDLSS